MMLSRRSRYLLIVGLVFIGLLSLQGVVLADTDIKITIDDPDHQGRTKNELGGYTVYSVLSSPQVGYGENRELGTLRATGKPGITVPVAVGQKVRVTLPVGLSYMQIPTSENYRNYVEWPALLDGQANQIADQDGKPGMKFISGSPRTLTLQVDGLNEEAPVMVLDFMFNKADYSTVRVSRMLEEVEKYSADPTGEVNRMDFFKLMIDVSLPFSSGPLISADSKTGWEDNFTDLENLPAADLGRISPLLEGGFVNGYPDGQLLAEQSITRAEAISLAGRLFVYSGKKAAFTDAIPVWAVAGIDSAVSGGIVTGYPDGSFRGERLLSKLEALIIAQNCLESRACHLTY